MYEFWEFEHRQARFIVNSVRGFEFFRQQWAIPLWDYELIDFFLSVPVELRLGKRLYVNTMCRRLYKDALRVLRDIPLASGQCLGESVSAREPSYVAQRRRASALRAFVRGVIGKIGLLQTARRLRASHKEGSPLAFDCWFADGRNPRLVTFGEVAERYRFRERLPASLWRILEPHSSRLLFDVNYNGVLSAVVLANEYEKCKLRGT